MTMNPLKNKHHKLSLKQMEAIVGGAGSKPRDNEAKGPLDWPKLCELRLNEDWFLKFTGNFGFSSFGGWSNWQGGAVLLGRF